VVPVEILKSGITAKQRVYQRRDIEHEPDDILLTLAEEGKRVRFVKKFPSVVPTRPKKTDITVARNRGGLGDVISCLAALKGLKNKYPEKKVAFMVDERYLPIAQNLKYIDALVPYEANMLLPEGVINLSTPDVNYERGRENIGKNRIEIYCAACGVEPSRPEIKLTKAETRWGKDFANTDNIKIGIQYKSAGSQRNVSDVLWGQLYDSLIQYKELQLYLFHTKKLPDWIDRDIVPVIGYGLRETASIVNQMDLMITLDSGLMHLAGALGKRVLALFGPSDPKVQLKYYNADYVWPGQGLDCCPCWGVAKTECPERKCMTMIKSGMIMDKVVKRFDLRIQKKEIYRRNRQPSIFDHDLKKEIVYDSRHDQIGDQIGVAAMFQFITQKYPARVSWVRGICNRGEGESVRWSRDFNILDWIKFPIHRYYDEPVGDKDRIAMHSYVNGSFYIWDDVKRLADKHKFYPKMVVPEHVDRMYKLPEQPYIVVHVLQRTGKRDDDQGYVSRRALDFEKYASLCRRLSKNISVVRVGAKYDSIEPIAGITDLTSEGLLLNETLKIISGASLFMGGDTGLKLAASALGIPVIIEVDDYSKALNGLAGCRPDLLHCFRLGEKLDMLLNTARKIIGGCNDKRE